MDLELINSREFAKRVINYRNDAKIQDELQKIHYECFAKYFRSNCGSCIKKAYVTIREFINTKIILTKKQMGQFELHKSKTGISKQIHIDHSVITNDNLTDEKALNILKKCPGHIVTFSRYPENWKVLAGLEIVETKKPVVEIKQSSFTESKPKKKGK